MKEWLKKLDTSSFEENLKGIGFSAYQINAVKARVETYLIDSIIKQVELNLNPEYDNDVYTWHQIESALKNLKTK